MTEDKTTSYLELARKEVQGRIEEITREAARRIGGGDFDAADPLYGLAESMCEFGKRLASLHQEWTDLSRDTMREVRVEVRKSGHDKRQKKHAPPRGMTVCFTDGTVVSDRTACRAFARAIEHIGAEEVARWAWNCMESHCWPDGPTRRGTSGRVQSGSVTSI